MNCPACHEEISSASLNNYGGYKLYQCHACDLMFWHPMTNPGSDWYQSSLVLTPYRPVWLAHWGQRQFLKDMLAGRGQLLDIGCGLGDFLFKAQEAGYSVTGIDFSPNCIEIARGRFDFKDLHPLTLKEFIAEKPDSRYDVITFFEVLEHLDNVADFLPLVKTLLKPGGYVACSVPNRAKWRFPAIIEECDYPPNHFTHWSPRALTHLFTSHGFSILAIKSQPLISYDHGWFYLVSRKLGLQQLGGLLVRGLKPKSTKPGGVPSSSMLSTVSGMVVKLGIKFYVAVVLPLLGLLTFPLWVLFRKQGSVIYLLATMKKTK